MSAFKTPNKKHSGDFKIAKGVVVCSEAELFGDITIGGGTVVHPSAHILAQGGPIVIGERNLIQEQVTIINSKREDGSTPTMVIGNGNIFEVGAHCGSLSVGDGNTFEAKSRVSERVKVTDRCSVGAGCSLDSQETLPTGTVLHGRECHRYTKKIPTQNNNQQQLDYLIKVLPNYHRLTKSTAPASTATPNT
ncbi:Dynactin subunit 6 [Geodia barretti]|uniref:Dynactin subunit 6 n=1 Tax=Geodia barretti TaxID=519541 RepID=A0AA35RU62_GEOBA|nr:Dynactin subunit 6 [Geodia barretti]